MIYRGKGWKDGFRSLEDGVGRGFGGSEFLKRVGVESSYCVGLWGGGVVLGKKVKKRFEDNFDIYFV